MRFNWEFYVNINIDLLNNGINNEEVAYEHFKKHGIKEKRIYCDVAIFFNWNNYINNHQDLKHINTELEAWKHFLYHGKKEQRIINNQDYLIQYCI